MTLKSVIILFSFVLIYSSSNAKGLNACGFYLPERSNFQFKRTEECRYIIAGHPNYLEMNSINLFQDSGLDNRLSDQGYIYDFDHGRYFTFDEVDDPKITRHTINNSAIAPVDLGEGLHAYVGEWVGFVQLLANYKEQDSYSVILKCVSIALGNKNKSMTTRFCAPHNASGDALVKKYKLLILRAKPYK